MESHEPDFIVVGEKVALGPLRRDLVTDYVIAGCESGKRRKRWQ